MAKATHAKLMREFTSLIVKLQEEGISTYGFFFTDHGDDATRLDCFNSKRDPLPVYIAKIEESLKVIRTMPPEDASLPNMEQEFAQAHADALSHTKKIKVVPN